MNDIATTHTKNPLFCHCLPGLHNALHLDANELDFLAVMGSSFCRFEDFSRVLCGEYASPATNATPENAAITLKVNVSPNFEMRYWDAVLMARVPGPTPDTAIPLANDKCFWKDWIKATRALK